MVSSANASGAGCSVSLSTSLAKSSKSKINSSLSSDNSSAALSGLFEWIGGSVSVVLSSDASKLKSKSLMSLMSLSSLVIASSVVETSRLSSSVLSKSVLSNDVTGETLVVLGSSKSFSKSLRLRSKSSALFSLAALTSCKSFESVGVALGASIKVLLFSSASGWSARAFFSATGLLAKSKSILSKLGLSSTGTSCVTS